MMTLGELDKKLASEPTTKTTTTNESTTVVTHNRDRDGYSKDHGLWLKQRMAEDAILAHSRCPQCGMEVSLSCVNKVTYYNCVSKEHSFTRWAGLMIANKSIIREYDDSTRYWEKRD